MITAKSSKKINRQHSFKVTMGMIILLLATSWNSVALVSTKANNANSITEGNPHCYAYLTQLVRSSNFPFQGIDTAAVNLLIDEDAGSFLRLKLFIETDGAGTIGWVMYYPEEKKLSNISANLEEPEQLKFNELYANLYASCIDAPRISPTPGYSCIKESKIKFPVTESAFRNDAAFDDLDCHLKNEEAYLCGRTTLRYIPLSVDKDLQLIVVPMDCGDFSDRYYLLSITEGTVRDALYINGVWQEPESKDSKEITRFMMNSKQSVQVSNLRKGRKETKNYTINQDGQIKLME